MTAVYPHNVDQRNTTIGGSPLAALWIYTEGMKNDAFPYRDIGERLSRIRNGFSEMSQREWAEKHGFSPTRYNNWEKGTRRIPVDEAERLCNLYGLTLDAVYRGRLDGLSENARKVF